MAKTAQPPSALSDEEQRRQAAQLLSKFRWAGTTPEERAEFMAQVAAQRTPETMGAARRSDKPRCPCGQMTLKRAQARRHKCVAPPKAKKRTKSAGGNDDAR